MPEPEEETPHPSPVKGRRSLITEQRGAEWLWMGKGGVLVTLTFGAGLEMPAPTRTPRKSKVIWNLPQNSQLVQSRQCCCCEHCGRGCCTQSPEPSCPCHGINPTAGMSTGAGLGSPWIDGAGTGPALPLTRVSIRPLPLISVIRFCPWHKHSSLRLFFFPKPKLLIRKSSGAGGFMVGATADKSWGSGSGAINPLGFLLWTLLSCPQWPKGTGGVVFPSHQGTDQRILCWVFAAGRGCACALEPSSGAQGRTRRELCLPDF